MKKRVFLIAHVDKRGIETRHELLYLGKVEIPDGVGSVAGCALQRHQPSVLKEGGGNVVGVNVNY